MKLKPVALAPATTPAPFEMADAVAIQALMAGVADELEQKRGMKWILEQACGLPVWGYRESARETDIALGRHFVAQQVLGLNNLAISKLQRSEHG